MGRGTSDRAAGTGPGLRLGPKPSSPSKIARSAAEATWPQVQIQRKIAKGVFGFTCAGHGGIVAVIGQADLPEAAIEAARKTGKIEVILEEHDGARRKLSSQKYSQDSLREYAAARPDRRTLTELWMGEEDCDWATILYSNPDLIQNSVDAGYMAPGLDLAAVRNSIERWNERFLAELEPDHVPIPGGELDKAARRQEILDGGGFVRDSDNPFDDNLIDVTFKDADGRRRIYRMSRAVYREIPWEEIASPDDFREIGEIVLLHDADA